MSAYAVIGAFYGDEGKGLVTDYLADKLGGDNVVVVRSNGGAQAAHTVQTPDGRRHVFHHFGSGSFVGARTHLSRFMICNPIAFNEEWDRLVSLGVTPVVTVDPRAMVTTPFDMLLNQAIEVVRNRERHGSCGLGINETVERCDMANEDQRTTVGDLIFPAKLWEKLEVIRNQWVVRRWSFLAYNDLRGHPDPIPPQFVKLLADPAVLNAYMEQIALFMSRVTLIADSTVLAWAPRGGKPAEHVIFEGAQGLLLHEKYGTMPYCTRSETGLLNIMCLCGEMGVEELNAHYVMRAYTTRHGAGPLDGEVSDPAEIGVKFDDPTNVHNQWQGTIRVAPINYTQISFIGADWRRSKDMGYDSVTVNPTVVITCMDQMTGDIIIDGMRDDAIGCALIAIPRDVSIQFETPSIEVLTSWGPTRATMRRNVVESFVTQTHEDTRRLLKLTDLDGIPALYLAKSASTPFYFNWVTCLFENEEQRQLIRLAAPKELTKRVAAL